MDLELNGSDFAVVQKSVRRDAVRRSAHNG